MKTIYIKGTIKQDLTAQKFREQINFESKEKMRIIINSVGGSVPEGIEIYNQIKSYKGEIEIVIGSMAASIASYIAMAVPLENRKSFRNSSMMIHEAQTVAQGRARDFKIAYDITTGVNNIIADAYAENIGKTREEVLAMMSEDYYMIGWESLTENNMISDIIEPEEIDMPEPFDNDYDFLSFLFAELEKVPEASIIKQKMYQAEKESLKDIEDYNKGFEKMTALLKTTNQNQTPYNGDNDNNFSEVDMKLQEFLNANPEAKAEYESNLQSAKAEGKAGAEKQDVTNLVSAEKDRMVNILKLANVNLADGIIAALDEGKTAEQYAMDELARQNSMRAEGKTESQGFAQLKTAQTPAEQDKGSENKLDEEKMKTGVKNIVDVIGI